VFCITNSATGGFCGSILKLIRLGNNQALWSARSARFVMSHCSPAKTV
jgi:hypothetical protein